MFTVMKNKLLSLAKTAYFRKTIFIGQEEGFNWFPELLQEEEVSEVEREEEEEIKSLKIVRKLQIIKSIAKKYSHGTEIIEKILKGDRKIDIAQEIGVSKQYVSKILKKITSNVQKELTFLG
jgi:DNA-directed RNA polymerase specialized sigma subunit